MTESEMLDLQLLLTAANYNLAEPSDRERSNADLVRLFLAIQGATKPELTLEIGAFDARFSIEMKERGSRAIAFEANLANYERFRTEEPLCSSGVEYINKAVSGRDGQITFFVQKRVDGEEVDAVRGNNSMLKRDIEGIEYEEVGVDAVSIDSFLKAEGLQDSQFSAWVDVEGASGEALSGASGSLRYCRSILIEVEEKPFWTGQWLAPQVLQFLGQYGLVPIARDFEYDGQFNVVLVHNALMKDFFVRYLIARHYSEVAHWRRT